MEASPRMLYRVALGEGLKIGFLEVKNILPLYPQGEDEGHLSSLGKATIPKEGSLWCTDRSVTEFELLIC